MKRDRRLKDERGVAMVEFALVLPLLMLVLVGIFEFGRVFNYWIDATHLANEGARWAAVNRVPGNDLPTYVCSQASTAEMKSGLKVYVTFSTDGGQTFNVVDRNAVIIGNAVRVKVEKTSSFPLVGGMLKILGGSGFGTIKYSGTSTMRLDQKPTTYVGNATPTACT